MGATLIIAVVIMRTGNMTSVTPTTLIIAVVIMMDRQHDVSDAHRPDHSRCYYDGQAT